MAGIDLERRFLPCVKCEAMNRRILFVALAPVQLLDLVGPIEVFAHSTGYRWDVVTDSPENAVQSTCGLSISPARHFSLARGPVDTLLVVGGPGTRREKSPALLAWLRRTAARARRVGSVCTGAFVLAEAGLLEGKRAVTHWAWCDLLQQRFPNVRVEKDPIHLHDDGIYTSAGITAGIDLALALVEEDLGYEAATAIARELVMFVRRPGGQSQFSQLLTAQAQTDHPIAELQTWLADHLAEDLRVHLLAARCHMSPRHFARVFEAETGQTPARYVERARVEAARCLLANHDKSLKQIAALSGFRSVDVMRRTFHRVLGLSAKSYAAHWSRSER